MGNADRRDANHILSTELEDPDTVPERALDRAFELLDSDAKRVRVGAAWAFGIVAAETPGRVLPFVPRIAAHLEADSAEEVDFSEFTGGARWANVIAPRLRAMAGAADPGGKGTYTAHREVAAILPGCEEDEPAEADMVSSQRLYEALVDAYRTGALDSVEDTYYPDDSTFF